MATRRTSTPGRSCSAMRSAVIRRGAGCAPGIVYGFGTLCVQAVAGAAFGLWAARRGLPPEAIRSIALTTAARTLLWGGCAFTLFGLFALSFHEAAEIEIPVPLLHSIEP